MGLILRVVERDKKSLKIKIDLESLISILIKKVNLESQDRDNKKVVVGVDLTKLHRHHQKSSPR